ncbi:MAG: hypothetical protein J5803_00420 [Desulfovibrio sp.]|nr:hypothetical protein [Desulfovibrio sp.]
MADTEQSINIALALSYFFARVIAYYKEGKIPVEVMKELFHDFHAVGEKHEARMDIADLLIGNEICTSCFKSYRNEKDIVHYDSVQNEQGLWLQKMKENEIFGGGICVRCFERLFHKKPAQNED